MKISETNNLSDSHNLAIDKKENKSQIINERAKKKENIKAIVFLSSITGISILIGFCTTLVAVRKQDPKSFNEGIVGIKGINETGGQLALRALKWGTFYACTGCSLLFYGIWKFSGASSLQEFRIKMGNILPRIPKNNPPQSRTEFKNLTDLLKYISEDWGKSEKSTTDN